MKNTGYAIDYKRGIITISSDFAERAGAVNSKEYKEFRQLKKDYADFTIKYSPKANASKQTYKGLTISFMKQYIENHEDRDIYKTAFVKIEKSNMTLDGKKMKSYFPKLKSFFLETFPELTAEQIRMEIEAEKAMIKTLNEIKASKKTINVNELNTKENANPNELVDATEEVA